MSELYATIAPEAPRHLDPRFAQTSGAESCELVRNTGANTELGVFIAFMTRLGVGAPDNKQVYTLNELKNDIDLEASMLGMLIEDLGYSLTELSLIHI